MSTIALKGRTWDILAEHSEPYQHVVRVLKCGSTLATSYGHEFTTFKLHEDIAAFREFAMCVRHAVECNGKLDLGERRSA